MKTENLTVLSLFDGMSCMRITLDKMGITPSKYYASEIDPHANKEVAANWPDTIQLGDVTKWREWDLDWSKVDLLVGGSPCQGFSFAGKQAGTKANLNGVDFIIETREQYLQAKADGATFYSQSHLFWEYVLCLDYAKEQNPNLKFMLENVKMKKCFTDMITGAMGVEPVFINSSIVSYSSRGRQYWCNWDVTQPKDMELSLVDILESDFDFVPATVASSKTRIVKGTGNKAACLTSSYTGVASAGRPFIASKALIGKVFDTKYQITSKYYTGSEEAFRKLTVVECCRMLGVPGDYFKFASKTNSYIMLGNGWDINTIEHIFNCLFKSA